MNVLAIGCHPDDLEALCGGTLAKCAKRGDKVTMVTLANGSAGHKILSKEEIVKVRAVEAKNSAAVIGADYIGLGLDDMFVRRDYDEGVKRVSDVIRKTKPDSEERFKAIFELCWDIERSIFNFGGNVDAEIINGGKIKDYERMIEPDGQQNSSILSDHGFTQMGIANRLQYFLFVPEIKDKQKGLFENINYTELFSHLSDKDIFNALLLLFKRDSKKAFTENLFIRELKVDLEKTKEIVAVLTKYHLIRKTQIELDDEVKDVYTFFPNPSFVGLLIFAKEMIEPPHSFAFYSQGRAKPYLD